MKRFLSAGKGYALFPTNITTLFFMVLLAFSPMGSIYAQETSTPIPRVSAGQRVPEEFWTRTFEFYDCGRVYTRTLEEYRGKPLILAFWSISCGSCIHNFPILKKAMEQHGDRLAILPVNSYDLESRIPVIESVLGRYGEDYRIAGVMYDSYIKEMFPHGPIPHYVWIQPNGMAIAVTTSYFLNSDNISKFVKHYEKD